MKVTWNINLDNLAHGEHQVETLEGSMRYGKITKVNWREVTIGDQVLRGPESIELNSDASDFVTWNTIKSIQRR